MAAKTARDRTESDAALPRRDGEHASRTSCAFENEARYRVCRRVGSRRPRKSHSACGANGAGRI
jgi:hypothetical protein